MTTVPVVFDGGPRDGVTLALPDPCLRCGTSLSGHPLWVREGVYLVVVEDGVGRAQFISRARLAEFASSLGVPGDPDLGSEASTPGAPSDEGEGVGC